MSFKLGLVGLCTSHPECWVPIIRDMVKNGDIDVEIVAAWDSGETRPDGFAAEFCQKFDIPHAVANYTDMLPMVDGVIVHTTNWDRHVEQARPFVEADKAVMIDKPLAGNLRDLNIILDWIKQGKRVTGGSALRFSPEAAAFLATPESERGTLHTVYTAIGVDDYNYGIHGYALLCALMGSRLKSVRFLGSGLMKQMQFNWAEDKTGLMTFGKNPWLPFAMTAVTTKNIFQLKSTRIYESLLEKTLPYLSGKTDIPPLSLDEIAVPELAALAARQSWMNNGAEVFLTDLRSDDPGYDGTQFAREYRRTRLQPAAK